MLRNVIRSKALFVLHLLDSVVKIWAQNCNYQMILPNVNVQQSFGETQRKIVMNSPDSDSCAAACAATTEFSCNYYLTPTGDGGDCYLMDRIDTTKQFFVDKRFYNLYAKLCDGEAPPILETCEFLLNVSNINRLPDDDALSPGLTSQSSCKEFCLSGWQDRDCNAIIASPGTTWGGCFLYYTIPNTQNGSFDLLTKQCRKWNDPDSPDTWINYTITATTSTVLLLPPLIIGDDDPSSYYPPAGNIVFMVDNSLATDELTAQINAITTLTTNWTHFERVAIMTAEPTNTTSSRKKRDIGTYTNLQDFLTALNSIESYDGKLRLDAWLQEALARFHSTGSTDTNIIAFLNQQYSYTVARDDGIQECNRLVTTLQSGGSFTLVALQPSPSNLNYLNQITTSLVEWADITTMPSYMISSLIAAATGQPLPSVGSGEEGGVTGDWNHGKGFDDPSDNLDMPAQGITPISDALRCFAGAITCFMTACIAGAIVNDATGCMISSSQNTV